MASPTSSSSIKPPKKCFKRSTEDSTASSSTLKRRFLKPKLNGVSNKESHVIKSIKTLQKSQHGNPNQILPNDYNLLLLLVLQHDDAVVNYGFEYDAEYHITKVTTNTMAEKRLRLNDIILEVNGERALYKSLNKIQQIIAESVPCLQLTINRPTLYQKLPRCRRNTLSEVIETEHYDIFITQFDWHHAGLRFGASIAKLGAKDLVVTRVESLSLASYSLLVGDHIIDVNGTRVNDVTTMLRGIFNLFDKESTVTMLVKRPISQLAISRNMAVISVDCSLGRQNLFDPRLPNDAIKIACAERERRSKKAGDMRTIKGILEIPDNYDRLALENENCPEYKDRNKPGVQKPIMMDNYDSIDTKQTIAMSKAAVLNAQSVRRGSTTGHVNFQNSPKEIFIQADTRKEMLRSVQRGKTGCTPYPKSAPRATSNDRFVGEKEWK